jgi:hypothetical protein
MPDLKVLSLPGPLAGTPAENDTLIGDVLTSVLQALSVERSSEPATKFQDLLSIAHGLPDPPELRLPDGLVVPIEVDIAWSVSGPAGPSQEHFEVRGGKTSPVLDLALLPTIGLNDPLGLTITARVTLTARCDLVSTPLPLPATVSRHHDVPCSLPVQLPNVALPRALVLFRHRPFIGEYNTEETPLIVTSDSDINTADDAVRRVNALLAFVDDALNVLDDLKVVEAALTYLKHTHWALGKLIDAFEHGTDTHPPKIAEHQDIPNLSKVKLHTHDWAPDTDANNRCDSLMLLGAPFLLQREETQLFVDADYSTKNGAFSIRLGASGTCTITQMHKAALPVWVDAEKVLGTEVRVISEPVDGSIKDYFADSLSSIKLAVPVQDDKSDADGRGANGATETDRTIRDHRRATSIVGTVRDHRRDQ